MVELVVEKPWFEGKPTSLLAMGIFEDTDKDHENFSKYIGTKSADALKEILSGKAFVGKFGTSFLLPLLGNKDIKKILLLGLGKKEKFTRETARIMAGKSALKSREINETNFSIFPFGEPEEEFIEPMAEGILLSLYDFDRYKTANSEIGDCKIQSVKLLVSEGNIENVHSILGRI
jgi:leucyl aminopeptidase